MALGSVSRSITSATGSSQTIAEANLTRKELYLENISDTTWSICLTGGTASAGGVDCISLAAGARLSLYNTNKITGISTSTKKLTAVER